VSISKLLHRWRVKLVGFISVCPLFSLMNFEVHMNDLFGKKWWKTSRARICVDQSSLSLKSPNMLAVSI